MVKTLAIPEKFAGYIGTYDLNLDGKEEYVWYVSKGAVVLNRNLQIIYRFEKPGQIFKIEQGRDRPIRFAILNNKADFYEIYLQPVSFLRRFSPNRWTLGTIIFLFFNLMFWIWVINRNANWKWQYRQFRYFEDSLSAMLVLDNRGHVVACNQRATQLLNRSSQEIRHLPVEKLFMNELQSVGSWIFEHFPSRRNAYRHFQIPGDATIKCWQIFLRFLKTRLGRYHGAIVILNDLTQPHPNMLLFTVAQKLAQEIKNPLNAIHLSLKRMRMEYENDPVIQKRFAELVNSSLDEVNRLRCVLDDFLSYTRIVPWNYNF